MNRNGGYEPRTWKASQVWPPKPKMKYRPTGCHLLVKEEIPEQIGNIYLTEKLKMSLLLAKPRVFRVLAKGPGRITRKGVEIPIECEVGDRLIVHSYLKGPQDMPDGLHIITEEEVLAVMPGGKP